MGTNVQHFADLGVYKQLKKKTHLTKDGLFPHLPGHPEADSRKVFKTPTNNNNNNNNNNNITSLVHLQKKMKQLVRKKMKIQAEKTQLEFLNFFSHFLKLK